MAVKLWSQLLINLWVINMTFKSFKELGTYWFQNISKSKKSSYSSYATSFKVKESKQEIERFARANRSIGYNYKND